MTISKDRRELYVALGAGDRLAVDRAYTAAVGSLVGSGVNIGGDDRAENLVGAIARYLEDCRK